MKKVIWNLLGTAVLAGTMVCACSSPKENKETAEETGNELPVYNIPFSKTSQVEKAQKNVLRIPWFCGVSPQSHRTRKREGHRHRPKRGRDRLPVCDRSLRARQDHLIIS